MNAALIFTVPEPVADVIPRCRAVVSMLGAPLKSDSGHFITGVVPSGPNSIEIRVTWLNDVAGSQITVSASHENVSEPELENVCQKFKYQYLSKASLKPKSSINITPKSVLFLIGALAAIAVFIFAIIKH